MEPHETTALQQVFAADFCDDDEGKAFIRSSFERGYLMDPHTATCSKARQTLARDDIATIVYSTANALTGEVDAHDLDALRSTATIADTPIPAMIAELFDKPITQSSVIDKQHIEREVLAFL